MEQEQQLEHVRNTKGKGLIGVKRPRGTGRKKIEIKKIEKKDYLNTTFTKRRNGLFKKANELCTLSGAEVGIVVFSPYRRPYVFGNPDADAVFDRYLNEQEQNENTTNTGNAPCSNDECVVDDGNKEGTEEEKKGFWWEESVEGLGLEELEDYKVKLMELRNNVANRVEDFKAKKLPLKDFLSTRFC